jgi:alkenylglycerophosphocholine/alkenylglycerophosphoethanolamine hydrolase
MTTTSHSFSMFSSRTKLIATIGLLAAAVYIYAGATDSYWLGMASKPVPVLAMAAWLATLPRKGRMQAAMILGLLLCALGDVLLETSPEAFLFGLIAFLLGHVAYIIGFLQDSRGLYPLRALMAYAYGALVYAYLLRNGELGGMAVPVLIYMLVICTMLWRAAARVRAPGIDGRSAWIGLIGAIFFTLSDTLLAMGMFAGLQLFGQHAVIVTYWLGQLGIMLAAGWQERPFPDARPPAHRL